jgi:phosphate transport system substrate-binding protein
MKQFLKKSLGLAASGIIGLACATAGAETLNGAGASFPAPVYRIWTYTYGKQAGTKVNYQSVGSGAGIAQIKAKTVDFGASDKPLTKEDLDKAGLIQFPMLMGGVVPVVNLPGITSSSLKLTPEVLADIFLGKIKKWNDPAIKKLNPDLHIMSYPITVVHRSDGSGTTWIFTNYLSKISKEWEEKVGCGKAVKWPVGIGGQKNPGVVNTVKKVKGSIGYTEYTYATEAKLDIFAIKNKAGKFVKPGMDTFQAAGANADWSNAPGFRMVLTDQPGDKSWPITGVTYILIYKDQKNAAKAEEMLKYFSWCYKDGAKMATGLNYVPIPENVVDLVKDSWKKTIKAGGKPVYK